MKHNETSQTDWLSTMLFYKGILGICNAFLAIIGDEFHHVIQS